MIFERAMKWGNENPRRLFLVDGLGAMLSAFLLGVVLVELEQFWGIPRSVLYFLAMLPCLFAVYDFCCYQIKRKNVGVFLRGIALMNFSYCVLSIGLALYHFQRVTYLGWAYVMAEVLVVITLASLEIQVAKSLISSEQISGSAGETPKV